eukprot:TRINITY_DN118_c1_g2_i3.p2 TRINITY_DN118_c1_g2~~TRINITY_DN118_c1_g2_i3.p2  ORF type:complete len:117 (-),score=36.56 TRINITY_DN118_c1_g2_i3:161-511(-)
MQIWDTAGQERFRTITSSYYRGAHGIIIVYDITNKESFDHVERWLNEIKTFAGDNVEKVLVGNKCDLESKRVVPTVQGEKLAKSLGIDFIETSAKDCLNIEQAFAKLAKNILQTKR